MLVLAVLGVIFSIGVVKLTGTLPRYRLRTAARETGSRVEEARMMAISRGSWTGVRYLLDEGRCGYTILPPAPAHNPEEPIDEREPFETIYFEHTERPQLSHFPGVSITSVEMRGTGLIHDSGTVDVYFSPTGTEGSHIIHMQHREGGVYTITFNALTGTVDFHKQDDGVFDDFAD